MAALWLLPQLSLKPVVPNCHKISAWHDMLVSDAKGVVGGTRVPRVLREAAYGEVLVLENEKFGVGTYEVWM